MIALLFPPFADPTQSYPALPLLKGYLNESGLETRIIDLNIDALWDALGKEASAAVRGFQQEGTFYDKRQYARSAAGLGDFYRRISQTSGYLIDNNRHFDPDGPWNIKKLRRYFKERKSPFHRFYEKALKHIIAASPSVVGINLTFASQIPEAFYLAMYLKERMPKAFVLLGGALAGQIASQISQKTMAALFAMIDGICYFEGGPALRSAATQWDAHGKIVEPVPNTWTGVEGKIEKGPPAFADFENAPLPDFENFDWNKYLSPSPIILFHPSAGCYWNRCSFCRYGFNQECGTRYREMPPLRAVSQIRALKEKWGVENFYMSADVLSPKFAIRFAEAVAEEKLKIHWSTDLRVEKKYSRENAKKLADGGLVSVALGIESGSDRLLQKMDKGVQRAAISDVSRALHEADIAVCWMMFHYHPTETYAEALETVRFLETHRREVSLFIIGEFGLTPHSFIFNHPEQFGIRSINHHKDDEFKLYPYPAYSKQGKKPSTDFVAALDKRVREVSSSYRLRPYPYAGAISTHHSMLYFIRFGKDVFRIR